VRDCILAAVGDRVINAAQYLSQHVCDTAVEISCYRLIRKCRVAPFYIRVGPFEQAVQEFATGHVAYFDPNAGPIIAEHKLIIRRKGQGSSAKGYANGANGTPDQGMRSLARDHFYSQAYWLQHRSKAAGFIDCRREPGDGELLGHDCLKVA
jgi:hypothetical protein